MRQLAAICLDLDDTLWAVGPVLQRAEQAMYDWLAQRCPRVTGRHDLAGMRALRQQVAARNPLRNHDLSFLRHETLRQLVTDAGYREQDADDAFAVFYRARNEVELFADVRPALQRLRSRYRLLTLTNGNADLGAIGLAGFFEVSLAAGEAGVAKPDPGIFTALLDRAGLAPGAVAYAGDDPVVDMEGARRVGLATVWVDRNSRPWPAGLAPPDWRVRDLNELAALLS